MIWYVGLIVQYHSHMNFIFQFCKNITKADRQYLLNEFLYSEAYQMNMIHKPSCNEETEKGKYNETTKMENGSAPFNRVKV